VKNLRYGRIVRRIGIILLLTGIVIALVSTFRDFDRLSSSTVTYIWVGLILVGAILLIVFVIDFELKERRLKFNPTNQRTRVNGQLTACTCIPDLSTIL
jgi:uncharacterized membrane protein